MDNSRPSKMILRNRPATFGLFCIILSSYPFRSSQQVSLDNKYVGCFADDFDRILPDYECVQREVPECPDCAGARADDLPGRGSGCQNVMMTVDICLALCETSENTFAGLQSGNECYCGKADAVYRKFEQDEGDCNAPCGGNPAQTCGGQFWVSVYDLRKTCAIQNLDQFIFSSEPTEFDGTPVIFDEGKQLTFECQQGYTLTGQGSISCQADGSFLPAVPTCAQPASVSPVMCPTLTAPTQGTIAPKQGTFHAGQIARFTCGIGYVVRGPSMVTCGDDGEWSDTELTTCMEMLCPFPPDVPNTRWVLNTLGRNVGGSAIYVCLGGFTSQFTATGRICSEAFEWIGPEPTCVKEIDPNAPPDNQPSDTTDSGIPALVWIFIIIVIICVMIFLAGCFVTRTGSSGSGDYKRPDPFLNDGIVVSRNDDKYPYSTTNTAPFVGAAVATVSNEPDFGIPAENYSSRATSEASGTLRGLSANEADKYIDSLFDMDGLDGNKDDHLEDDFMGPYDNGSLDRYGSVSKAPSPYHHPEPYDDYPPPPPLAEPEYHDLERQRFDTPPPPEREMELPAHSGPSGSVSRSSMYLPPDHDYPSVADPVNTHISSPVPSEDQSTQNPDTDFLDEVDEFFDGVNNKIDNCMMQ